VETMIHILHLEDDPADAELVQATLAEAGLACHMIRAQTRDEFETGLGDGGTEIILADYRLPTYDGMSALRLSRELRSDIPFIFVSGVMGEEAAIEALTRGATDYVLKHNLSRLAPAVQRALQEARNRRERRQAQEALKESEARYVDLYDNAPDMYVSVNAQTASIEKCNQTLADTLGRPKAEIIGRPVFEIYHPDCLDQAKAAFQEFLERGVIHDKELQLRKKDGSKLDVSLNVSAVRARDGTIVSSRSTLRDITERRRNRMINAARIHLMQFAATHPLDELFEEAVNEAEKVTESLIGFYHFIDDDQQALTLQNWSTRTKAQFCKTTGKGLHYPIAEAGVWVDCVRERRPVVHNDYLSLAHRKGMPEGHAEVVRELVVPVMRGEKIKAILGVGNKPVDYSQKDVEAMSLLADLVWETVTSKRAEEALRRSEEKHRSILQTAMDGFMLIDNQGRLLGVNEAYCNLSGYSEQELLSMHICDLAAVEAVDEIANHTQKVIDQGQHRFESRHRHKNGTVFDVEVCAQYQSGDGGRFITFLRDITERKRSEGKIRKLNKYLEKRVAERTIELESRAKKLQQLALELSGAEDRERRHIASILHDDFQQQLAYIKLELDLLRKQTDEKLKKRLGLLTRLTAECIEKSRNLSYELNPPALHRSGLLAAIDALAKDIERNQGLAVMVQTEPNAEPASFSLASILYRSVRELLFNVVKHAGANSAVVDVRSKRRLIYIRVEDNGNGFDFDAVRSGQGSDGGFGLYNIEDRMTSLGGSMKVNTKPGKGCSVLLTVPKNVSRKTAVSKVPLESSEPKESVKDVVAKPIQPVDNREQIRILLADDHKLIREALAKLLQDCTDLTVVGQAVDGREVVRLAAQLKPHVILMDVTMPGLNGFEATAQIIREYPDIRIIGLSMHNDADTHQNMINAGASAYLTKTGSPDALIGTIRRLHYGEPPDAQI
jgi:PAS domain S-box-containing protein